MTGADFFADVEHGRFVALAFADDDLAAHRHGVHDLAHGFDGDVVGVLALALSHGLRRSDRRRFDDAQELKPQLVLHLSFHCILLV